MDVIYESVRMSCMGNILMHLFLGKPHVGSTDPFLTPHAKVSTRRSDARQSQGNYEDWKPLLKKTFCCLFIQQFLDMLVEIKIECVGSTIIQFPPSRRHMCFTVQPIPPIKHWQSFRIPYMFFLI